jgi:hypothetical protein
MVAFMRGTWTPVRTTMRLHAGLSLHERLPFGASTVERLEPANPVVRRTSLDLRSSRSSAKASALLRLVRPWGFDLAAVMVPVGIWWGTDDAQVSAEHAEYLLAHIATAQAHVYTGGHLPGADMDREIYDWLDGDTPPGRP